MNPSFICWSIQAEHNSSELSHALLLLSPMINRFSLLSDTSKFIFTRLSSTEGFLCKEKPQKSIVGVYISVKDYPVTSCCTNTVLFMMLLSRVHVFGLCIVTSDSPRDYSLNVLDLNLVSMIDGQCVAPLSPMWAPSLPFLFHCDCDLY